MTLDVRPSLLLTASQGMFLFDAANGSAGGVGQVR